MSELSLPEEVGVSQESFQLERVWVDEDLGDFCGIMKG